MAHTSIDDLPLLTISESGAAPKSRLKDVKAATDIYQSLRKADESSAINRARVQAMFDGVPPYSDSALAETGQAYRCNLNFGQAESILEGAMAAYVDLVHSVEDLVRVETTLGEIEQRNLYNKIISEEVTRTIRHWPKFNQAYLNLCTKFVGHGVGVAFFEDAIDWRWNSKGLGDVLIPRQTQASEHEIEVITALSPTAVNHLYHYIEDPKAASDLGWNVTAVRDAIIKAMPDEFRLYNDWERVQDEIKNNDIYSGAKAAKVMLVHIWVQEFDGSVSHYISLDNGSNNEFLYKAVGKYSNISQAFVFFTYGIGTNGTYHSIRGLGYKIFPQVQVSNRLQSTMVDNGMLSSSVMLQPQDERALENFSFNYMGPFALLSPNMNFIERSIPNLTNNAIPILNDLRSQINDRAGQYTANSLFSGNRERTRFEVAAHLEEAAKLNVTALNLFYEPFDRLLRETVRRITNPEYTLKHPGGEEVTEFRMRCMERGVPPEVIDTIDHRKTRAVRAIGSGSQAQRTVQLQSLNEFAGAFDQTGRYNLFRDQVAASVGIDQANRYMPPIENTRLPMDAKIAQMENSLMEMNGQPAPVIPNELHLTHLDQHMPFMQQYLDAVEQNQIDIADAYIKVLPHYQHSVQHLEFVQQDTTISDQVAKYREMLQQYGEILNNGQKKLATMQQEQAEAQAQEMPAEEAASAPEQAQQASPEVTPEMQQKLAEHRLKLQMMQEEHEMKMMLQMQEAEIKRQQRDAEKAADLRELLK